jgi:ribosomal protein S18 acetylase RimI-like enzyme
MAALALHWRTAAASDSSFLQQLFASTRQAELDALGPGTPLAQRFLAMQWAARDLAYRSAHPVSQQRIVMRQVGYDTAVGVGVVWLAARPGRIDLLDISLLPQWRGRGIGTALMQSLLARAQSLHQQVALQVRTDNPARLLYARLGFADVGHSALDVAMRWTPAPPAPTQRAAETAHEQT